MGLHNDLHIEDSGWLLHHPRLNELARIVQHARLLCPQRRVRVL
jgi:hypothetical protein